MKVKKAISLHLEEYELNQAIELWIKKYCSLEIVHHLQANNFMVDINDGQVCVLIDGEIEDEN